MSHFAVLCEKTMDGWIMKRVKTEIINWKKETLPKKPNNTRKMGKRKMELGEVRYDGCWGGAGGRGAGIKEWMKLKVVRLRGERREGDMGWERKKEGQKRCIISSTPPPLLLWVVGAAWPPPTPHEREREKKKKLCETFPRQRGGEAEWAQKRSS